MNLKKLVLVFSMNKTWTAGKKIGYQRDSFFLVPDSVRQSSIYSDSSVKSYRGHRQRQE